MAKKLSMSKLLLAVLCFVAGGRVAAAVVTGDRNGFNTLKGACDGTPHPDTCYSVLVRHNGSYPDPNVFVPRLAGQAVFEAVPILMDASSTAHDVSSLAYLRLLNVTDYYEVTGCFSNCSVKLLDASFILVDSYRDTGVDLQVANFTHVQAFLAKSKEKHVQWNCDACLRGDEIKIADEVAKGSKLDKFMAVMSSLVDYGRNWVE